MIIGESITIKLKPSPKDPYTFFGELNNRYYTIHKSLKDSAYIFFSVYNKGDKEPFYSINLNKISIPTLWNNSNTSLDDTITKLLRDELFDENGEFLIKKYEDFQSNLSKEQLDKLKDKNRLKNYEHGEVKITKDFTHFGLFFDEENDRIYLALAGGSLQLTEIIESDLKKLR